MSDLIELMHPPGPWDTSPAVVDAQEELDEMQRLHQEAAELAGRIQRGMTPARRRLGRAIVEARKEYLNLHGIPLRLRLRRTKGDRRVVYRECVSALTDHGLWVMWLALGEVRLLHAVKTSKAVVYRLVDPDGTRWTVYHPQGVHRG